MSRVGLDSNILLYLAGVCKAPGDEAKVDRVQQTVDQLAGDALVAPVQALGEVFAVLRRIGVDTSEARRIVLEFTERFAVVPSDVSVLVAAMDLVVDHRLQLWDSLIVNAVAAAGCNLLLSEDMQDGFTARGVTIVNPLAVDLHPKLAKLLA